MEILWKDESTHYGTVNRGPAKDERGFISQQSRLGLKRRLVTALERKKICSCDGTVRALETECPANEFNINDEEDRKAKIFQWCQHYGRCAIRVIANDKSIYPKR